MVSVAMTKPSAMLNPGALTSTNILGTRRVLPQSKTWLHGKQQQQNFLVRIKIQETLNI